MDTSADVAQRGGSSGPGFYTYDEFGNQTTWNYPKTWNHSGTTFVGQDSVAKHGGWGYDWSQGTVYYRFYTTNCSRGKAYKGYSQLAHTWSTTGLSGFGVSVSGFSVSWSSSGHDWTASYNQVPTWYPCG